MKNKNTQKQNDIIRTEKKVSQMKQAHNSENEIFVTFLHLLHSTK